MNSRERVQMALSHKEPDRLPFDLGGSVLTSIHVQAYRKLRRYLGLPEIEPTISDIFQQIVQVDDDLLERLGVDVKNVAPRSSATFQIDVRDMGDYTYFYDEFKIGWRMPKDGGLYYDMFAHPLSGSIDVEDVDHFPWPDPLDPSRFFGLRDAALNVAEREGRAVLMGNMAAGVLEVTAWMRGFADYFADLAGNQKLISRVMDKVLELKMAYWGKALELVGDVVDVVQDADDFAGQFGMLISPQTYRALVKPRHKELLDFIHSRTGAKVFFHSCGSVRAVIPDLVEVGVDILNPVQVSATGMDSAELKREYGKELTFWGGGVDTQNVLGTGTPEEVREEVRRRLEDLMPDGGFVFATVHNIQGNVPPENIMALWETVQRYGVYG